MDGRRFRMTWCAIMCAGALTMALEAKAQSAAAASSAGSSASAIPDMTMGMGFMPLPGMFGSPTPSATDAAALGMTAQRGGMMGMGGGTPMTNPTMNPMASPLFYGSVFPMTQQQAGVLMLAGQAQMLGLGSGQLSGVRPGAAGAARGRQTQPSVRNRGSSGQPGGLAARYFNRTTQRLRVPQGFYNRQIRYYPQVGR
jgi:hypothetical protein